AAADVLLSLINDKIKFHTVQTLNLTTGMHEDKLSSVERIKELKASKHIVQHLVIKAHKENLELVIDSTINIQLQTRSQS
ncbi:MAG: hypothetical protein AAFZ89_13755, partial [Bacteroidota bacterium]